MWQAQLSEEMLQVELIEWLDTSDFTMDRAHMVSVTAPYVNSCVNCSSISQISFARLHVETKFRKRT